MRKKELIAQNLSLFGQLEALRGESSSKDRKIRELESIIEQLKKEPVNKLTEPTAPLKRLEEKVIGQSKLDPTIEYASAVIGKLVMESANGSNSLTYGGNKEHRELVNLLLGKTEVAKAEILAVVNGEGSFEDKKLKIDAVADETLDYFSSVLAQVN